MTTEMFESCCLGLAGWVVEAHQKAGLSSLSVPFTICPSEDEVKAFFEQKKEEGFTIKEKKIEGCSCCKEYSAYKGKTLGYSASRVPVFCTAKV